MATIVSDFIQENCTTLGTGPLELAGAVDSAQAEFKDNIPVGKVWYSILEEGNREVGEGDYDGANQIIRTNIHATLINSIWVSGDNVDPLPLKAGAVVSCTLNADAWNNLVSDVETLRVDVDNNTQSIADLTTGTGALEPRVTQNETDIAANVQNITSNTNAINDNTSSIVALDSDVSFRESAITALESGGLVTGNGPTSVLVAAGKGEIIDSFSYPEEQVTLDVSWDEQSVDLLASGGLPVVTGIGNTTIAIDANGVVGVHPGGLSSRLRRVNIRLASVNYLDRVISSVFNIPIVSNQAGNTLLDIIGYMDLSDRVKGLLLRPTVAVDLGFWRDSGSIFEVGSNYINAKDDQNILQVLAVGDPDVGQQFRPLTYNNGDPAVGNLAFQVPNDAWEEGGNGAVTSVTNGNAVIHYMFEIVGSAGSFYLSYGQQQYSGGYSEAVTNLFADRASHLFATEFNGMLLLAQIVVLKDATSFDGVVGGIFPLGSATTSGSGGGSSTQAINIEYTDTYAIGNNVQSALDSLAALKLSPNQHDAINAAATPTASNAYATIADITAAESDNLAPAIAIVGDPILDLPFANDFSILKGGGALKYSRQGASSYTDRYGTVHVINSDVPRIEKQGLLIESAATNYFETSASLDNFDMLNAQLSRGTGFNPDGSPVLELYEDNTLNTHGMVNVFPSMRPGKPSLNRFMRSMVTGRCYYFKLMI